LQLNSRKNAKYSGFTASAQKTQEIDCYSFAKQAWCFHDVGAKQLLEGLLHIASTQRLGNRGDLKNRKMNFPATHAAWPFRKRRKML
jgi:hypothetical protein